MGITSEQIEQLLPDFLGTIQQTPPQISAIKVGGHRAYKLARRGESVELEPRPVEVFSLKVTDFQPPEFELGIECGSGTYIRSIGRDLGERLGCGAVMSKLCRTTVGPFTLASSVSLNSLNGTSLREMLIPPLAVVAELPRRRLDQNEILLVRQGRPVASGISADIDSCGEVALTDIDERLIGIAVLDPATWRLLPRLILPATD